MRRFTWNLALCGLALTVAGCQQNNAVQKSAPGALPTMTLPEKDPELNASTYFAHAHLLERQGHFDKAAEQYRRAIELQPNFASAHNRLGITLNKLGQHAEATQQFEKALELTPNEAFLLNNLGFSLFLENKCDEAESRIRRALELKPDFARARTNYALVLAKLGRYDEAYETLRKGGDDADAGYNMGVILTEATRYREAARYLETALTARPNFEDARRQLRLVARLAAEQDGTTPPVAQAPTKPAILTARPDIAPVEAPVINEIAATPIPTAPVAVAPQTPPPAQPAPEATTATLISTPPTPTPAATPVAATPSEFPMIPAVRADEPVPTPDPTPTLAPIATPAAPVASDAVPFIDWNAPGAIVGECAEATTDPNAGGAMLLPVSEVGETGSTQSLIEQTWSQLQSTMSNKMLQDVLKAQPKPRN